jgi:DinB family protein
MPSGSGQIDALLSELRETTRRAEALFAGKSTEQLSASPGGKGWSATQCLAHLNLTNRAYLPVIDACLEEMKHQNFRGDGPFEMSWNARLLNWWLEPPSRLRLPTAPFAEPAGQLIPGQILAEFAQVNEQVARQLEASRGFALDRVKMASPFAKNMQYNVYSAFVLIPAHNRRHLWQASRALASIP